MNRYNRAPHLTKDANGKVTTSQLDITNESQEVSPFPASNHKVSTNRRAYKHNAESAVFLYCRFSLFLKDSFFQIIYCCNFLTLSNQTSRYKSKCIIKMCHNGQLL